MPYLRRNPKKRRHFVPWANVDAPLRPERNLYARLTEEEREVIAANVGRLRGLLDKPEGKGNAENE